METNAEKGSLRPIGNIMIEYDDLLYRGECGMSSQTDGIRL